MSCLESSRAKGTDITAAQQGNTSCPEPTDVSDQLSIAAPPDAEIESCSPVILDPGFSHGVGNLTSKSLQLTLEIWNWCESKPLYVIAQHVPGKKNVVADEEPQIFPQSFSQKESSFSTRFFVNALIRASRENLCTLNLLNQCFAQLLVFLPTWIELKTGERVQPTTNSSAYFSRLRNRINR